MTFLRGVRAWSYCPSHPWALLDEDCDCRVHIRLARQRRRDARRP